MEWDISRASFFEGLLEPGIRRGNDGLRDFFREWYEAWDQLEDIVEELIDHGEDVISVVTQRGRGRASGAEVLWGNRSGVWTIRDGKIVRVVWFATRGEALDFVGCGANDVGR